MSQFITKKLGPWAGEPRPLFLAPMAGVSDLPFRLLAKDCGADVTITEFTNSTALTREAAVSWRKMESDEREIPFIPQIFGGDFDDMSTAAQMLESSADIIDLNFGCPAPKVTKICAGAALMGEPDMLVEMVSRIVDSVSIPVTAKMRLGTGREENNATEICQRLQDVGAQRLCIHGRTLKQRYQGNANWVAIEEAVHAVEVPVIANGDVVDASSAAACFEQTEASGLMVGRGAIGRPSVFAEIKVGLGWMKEEELPWVQDEPKWFEMNQEQQQFKTRQWCWDRYIEYANQTIGIQPRWMQRHAVAFTKGLPGSKKVRTIMHKQATPDSMAAEISRFLKDGFSL